MQNMKNGAFILGTYDAYEYLEIKHNSTMKCDECKEKAELMYLACYVIF